MFLETPRLRLRPFVPQDADALFRFRSDPEVMRYIAVGVDGSIEDTRKLLDRYFDHQEKYGFSKWAVELRETGELIGDSGLLLLEEGPDFDLGYRFAREYWGKGFGHGVRPGMGRSGLLEVRTGPSGGPSQPGQYSVDSRYG